MILSADHDLIIHYLFFPVYAATRRNVAPVTSELCNYKSRFSSLCDFFIHHTATENEAVITKRRMSLPIKLPKLLLFVLAA